MHSESELFIERIFKGQNRFVIQIGTLLTAILALDLARLFNSTNTPCTETQEQKLVHTK